MSRFVNSFWGADGFDVIEKRLDQGMKSSDMLTYYVVERSNIEKGYAEKLQSLIRKTQALTEVGSSREAWLSMRGETDNLANVHLEFAKQLNEKIGVPMAKFKEDQRKLRKQYLGDAAKLNREMAKIKEHLDRSKEKYVKMSQEAEVQEQKINQLKSMGKPQKAINTEIAKLQQLSKTAMQLEQEYQKAVTALAAFQVEWVEKISGILEFLQIQEEQRIEHMKESLLRFVEVQKQVSPFLGEACLRVNQAVVQINKNHDISEFIREFGTGSAKPAPPVFEPFQRTGGGGGGAVFVAAPDDAPPFGGVAAPAAAPPPALNRNPIMKVKALYDYVGQDAGELDFLAGDMINVLDNKDPSGWWTGEIGGRTGLFPSNYVKK